jgi:hypothetical protein
LSKGNASGIANAKSIGADVQEVNASLNPEIENVVQLFEYGQGIVAMNIEGTTDTPEGETEMNIDFATFDRATFDDKTEKLNCLA